MTLKDAYKEALQIQDACNLSGVVFSFSRVMEVLNDEARKLGKGTQWRNEHPICIMFSSKIAHLTGCENTEWLSSAWETCKKESEA